MSRGPYRRHSSQFKLPPCHDIRARTIGRNEAQRKYALSASLEHLQPPQYDLGELDVEEVEAMVLAKYEARIAALERKIGQLTMEFDLRKKAPRLRPMSDKETSVIVTGPKAVPSDRGAV